MRMLHSSPCVFKLTEEDNELNEYLEARSYEAVTPTDVMLLELKDKTFQKGESLYILVYEKVNTNLNLWSESICNSEHRR